jgi:hypothetical protein
MASQDLVENMMGELGQGLDHLMDLCRAGPLGLVRRLRAIRRNIPSRTSLLIPRQMASGP